MSITEKKPEDLKIYELVLRASGIKLYQPATTEQEALNLTGVVIDDCFIVEQKPRRQSVPHHAPLVLVRIPCHVCPFQYGECKKPPADPCPVQPNAPELQEWLKQAAQAHLCDYYGQELNKTDYQEKRKWLPIEQAISELGDYR